MKSLTPKVQKAEDKMKEAEKYQAQGNTFHAQKSGKIAYDMIVAVMNNGDAVSEEDYAVANTWQSRLQAIFS